MKKVKILVLSMLAFCAISFAQETKEYKETKVTKFTAGASLTSSDVAFIDLVSGADASKSRGAGVKEAKIGKTTFTEGYKLTKADIDVINEAAKKYSKANTETVTKDAVKTAVKTRGCYYYCYYYYWNGYYYEYYYYCC